MSTFENDFAAGAGVPPPSSSHAVQFYEGEDALRVSVADFLERGNKAGVAMVVIASESHRHLFADELSARGIELDPKKTRLLDARATLTRFMIGALPDETLFDAVIGSVVRDSLKRTTGGRIFAYGEMVDLLWRDGNPEAAIRLEELWNELALRCTFDLLCAYPMGNFIKERHAGQFAAICEKHNHVIPAESYKPRADDDRDRLIEISRLQQKAASLKNEVEHRKELERALREALAARREAEQLVRRNERNLRDFVENASIGIHWVGPDGRILWANEAELQMLGYTCNEYVGRHITEFHADREAIDDILQRLSRNEEIRDYEARLITKDGSVRDVAISSNVLFEEDKFIHTRCFTRDITDRKRQDLANAFLLDVTSILNSSLEYESRLADAVNAAVPRVAAACIIEIDGERYESAGARKISEEHSTIVVPMRVADRTVGTLTWVRDPLYRHSECDVTLATDFATRAAIAVENARHFRSAQEANRAKDQFLATLSHELRTPLTAILGWARMLTLGGLDSDTVRVAIETIERSAKSQAAIIDDLLDLSRVVTGKLTLNTDLIDLDAVIDNAVQTLNLAAAAKEIKIDVSRPARGTRFVVNGDAIRLQQIVWNLISNAIKFSDHGAHVSVVLERERDKARITVRDTGHGIAEDFVPHVFEPFRQADGASTRAYNGLGLGLAIVKHLTEIHGGSVKAESEGIGKGATFTVILPLASSKANEIEAASKFPVTDLSTSTILVVDDDADTRGLLTAILHRCGARVTAVESVAKAVDVLRNERPNIVISDIAMPGQDGFALLDVVRAGDNGHRTPIIALTASNDPTSEERIRTSGFDAYVQKPLDPMNLASVIRDLVN